MDGDAHNVYIGCKCAQIPCFYPNLALWCLISAGEPHNKHFWPRMLSLLHNRICELLFNHNERKLYIMHQRVVINAVMYNNNGNVSQQQCISTVVVFESAQNFAQNVHCCWKALASQCVTPTNAPCTACLQGWESGLGSVLEHIQNFWDHFPAVNKLSIHPLDLHDSSLTTVGFSFTEPSSRQPRNLVLILNPRATCCQPRRLYCGYCQPAHGRTPPVGCRPRQINDCTVISLGKHPRQTPYMIGLGL